MLTLLLCASCGVSSSVTPPPLEPDPKRLVAPAEASAPEELVPASPAYTPPPPGAGSDTVEDGAEFGIEPGAAQASPANGAPKQQTWGAAPSTTKGKRPPPHKP
jgi:hypothetical protein